MGKESQFSIEPEAIEAYLRSTGHADAKVISLKPLGANTQVGLKAYGYGRPLHITAETADGTKDFVLRTMSPDPFGHMRRSDRAEQMVLSYDTFNTIPGHITALGVGAFTQAGEILPVPEGEFCLITNYVDGEIYAADLARCVELDEPSPLDVQRAEALGRYLADLHTVKADPATYHRELRDLLGSGEGIFGQTDTYPADDPVATPERLCEIEVRVLRWRWAERHRVGRARRTHGDFHPFNILFRDGADFSVLDCSRGGIGEPADDVTCMAINYIFFALSHRGRFDGPMRQLWDVFWGSYLDTTKDEELLEMVAPFFAWRAMVVVHPVWYPDLDSGIRDQILTFVERLLDREPFHPDRIDALLKTSAK